MIVNTPGLREHSRSPLRDRLAFAAALVATLGLALAAPGCGGEAANAVPPGRPWVKDAVTAEAFARELATASGADRPVIVCTAPPFLYRVGHIPGAVLYGPAAAPAAIDSLTAWARTLPPSANIVIYCGCCPIRQCPNLDPAYAALKKLGFSRVRVLALPDSFRTDWVDRGYPVER